MFYHQQISTKVDTTVVIQGDWRDIDFGPSEKRAPVGAQIKTYLVTGELMIKMMQEEVKEVAAKDASQIFLWNQHLEARRSSK